MRFAYIIEESEIPKDIVRIEFPIISDEEAAAQYGNRMKRQVKITTKDNGDSVLLINPTIKNEQRDKMIITKEFGKDFNSGGGALTLNSAEVTEGNEEGGIHERTHTDGWTIRGKIHEDYFVWVNEFEAHHPAFGKVWGDFEDKVFADSEEGFQHFFKNHKPEAWDYGDI